MFAAKQKQSEPDHLKPLDEAKRIFKLRLKSRIDSYEKRLKKPWYERGFEYLKSSYGKAGYLRTKDFLEAIDTDRISTTEGLIDLTNEAKYKNGYKLTLLLQCIVLEVCQFRNEHVKLIQDELVKKILDKQPPYRYAELELSMTYTKAIYQIYEQITKSRDYGNQCLNGLNNRLASQSKIGFQLR